MTKATRLSFTKAMLLAGFVPLAFARPALAADLVPPQVYTTTPGGINIADGVYTEANTDLSIGTLTLERFYLGTAQVPGAPIVRDPDDTFFGEHMSHNFDIYVAPNVAPPVPPFYPSVYKPIVHIGRSASGMYEQDRIPSPTIIPNSDDAMAGELELVSGTYVYTDQAGAIYTFNPSVPAAGVAGPSQRIAQIDFPDGRRQSFTYNGSGQLKLVSDTSGYAIVFDYAANGNVSAACGFNLAQTYVSVSTTCAGATLKTTYSYDGSDRLTGFTDVASQTTTYVYGTNSLCITPPGFGTCRVYNVYNSQEQVTQQTLGSDTWSFGYYGGVASRNTEDNPPTDGDHTTLITDPLGHASAYTFTRVTPWEATNANGNVTQYRFSGAADYMAISSPALSEGSMLDRVVLPEGNEYLVTYGPYNVVRRQTWQAKPGSGLSDIVVESGFGDCVTPPSTRQNCTQPIWRRDANLNQTDYTYNAVGQVLTEMQPAPSTGAARPLKIYTYAARYAYVKNAGGTLVASATAISQIATETLCQTVAGSSTPTCDPAAPQTVTTYEYGPNGTADNQRVRGAVVSDGTTSRRACFLYDVQGNRIAETSPRAGLSSCP